MINKIKLNITNLPTSDHENIGDRTNFAHYAVQLPVSFEDIYEYKMCFQNLFDKPSSTAHSFIEKKIRKHINACFANFHLLFIQHEWLQQGYAAMMRNGTDPNKKSTIDRLLRFKRNCYKSGKIVKLKSKIRLRRSLPGWRSLKWSLRAPFEWKVSSHSEHGKTGFSKIKKNGSGIFVQ